MGNPCKRLLFLFKGTERGATSVVCVLLLCRSIKSEGKSRLSQAKISHALWVERKAKKVVDARAPCQWCPYVSI